MANIKQPIKSRSLARIRWITAIISGLGVLMFSLCVVKPEPKQKFPDYRQTKPFITLIDETLDLNGRNYEAFFLPTRYNFNLKVKPPKIDLNIDSKTSSTKPIFSRLDRLRILRTFTNRFTESEYWTVSRIQMHPRNTSSSPEKNFVEDSNEQFTKKSEMMEKFYDLPTEFLFTERDGHSK